jgi:TonB family protein
MSTQTYRMPTSRSELPLGVMLGTLFSVALFVLMALAQMLGEVESSDKEIIEVTRALVAPEIEELEEIVTSTVEEEEAPPELEMEEEPLQLSLDQLDIALNPGNGSNGSHAGDFFLPTASGLLGTSQQNMQAFVDFADLDQRPRPIGVFGLNFPRRLLKNKVRGKIVLLLKLDPRGEILDVQIESSNLPDFDSFVLGEVKGWRFTPPTQQGRPVQAKARLPIPITIN